MQCHEQHPDYHTQKRAARERAEIKEKKQSRYIFIVELVYHKYSFTKIEVSCGCFDSSAISAVLMGSVGGLNLKSDLSLKTAIWKYLSFMASFKWFLISHLEKS